MAKTITYGRKLIATFQEVARTSWELFSSVYGPASGGVLLRKARKGSILMTRDGSTLARHVSFDTREQQAVFRALASAAVDLDEIHGDGCSAFMLLASSMLYEGSRLLAGGVSHREILSSLREALAENSYLLDEITIPVRTKSDILKCLSSPSHPEVPDLVARAVMLAGQHGSVVVEDAKWVESRLVTREGYIAPLISSYTAEEPPGAVSQPLVALFDCVLDKHSAIAGAASEALRHPFPFLVVAHSVEGEALATVSVNNKNQEEPRWFVVNLREASHKRRALFEDLAALSGATIVDPAVGMDPDSFDPDWLGSLQEVSIQRKESVLFPYPDATDRLQTRVNTLVHQKEESASDYDRDQLDKRIALLSGGLCVIELGDHTEQALKGKRSDTERALSVAKMALRGGAVPGAAVCYHLSHEFLSREKSLGARILGYGCKRVSRALVGSDENFLELCKKRESGGKFLGFDLNSGVIRDLKEDGPWDARVSVQSVFETAVSVCSELLCSGRLVTRAINCSLISPQK